MRELAEIVETGPDVHTDGVIRWRRVDLQAVIEERFGVVTVAIANKTARTPWALLAKGESYRVAPTI